MSFFDLPPIIERMLLVSDKISDLNFSVGQPPQVEINVKLTPVQPLGMQKLSPYQTELIAMTLMHGNPDAAERLAHTGTADLSYSLPSRTRFRVNIFQQRGSSVSSPPAAARGDSGTAQRDSAPDGPHGVGQELDACRRHRHHQRDEA